MLTDTKLRNLKPQDKLYKVVDRDGLYVVVRPGGAISFRLDYRLNGRRETLTIGRHGHSGITLAEAREQCIEAKKAISRGLSPAKEKQRGKQQLREAKTFGDFAAKWLKEYRMEESTRAMRERCGQKVANPGDGVSAASIAVFAARERALAPQEIRVFFEQLERVSTLPTIRLALRLVLLTLVRKSELLNAEVRDPTAAYVAGVGE